MASVETNTAAAAKRTAARAKPRLRGNVLNLGHTALIMFDADRPEKAARYASRTLESAALVQSVRVDEYMMRLEVAADRYSSHSGCFVHRAFTNGAMAPEASSTRNPRVNNEVFPAR